MRVKADLGILDVFGERPTWPGKAEKVKWLLSGSKNRVLSARRGSATVSSLFDAIQWKADGRR